MQPPDHVDSPMVPAVPNVEALTEALAAPFDPREVRFKPGVVSGNRARPGFRGRPRHSGSSRRSPRRHGLAGRVRVFARRVGRVPIASAAGRRMDHENGRGRAERAARRGRPPQGRLLGRAQARRRQIWYRPLSVSLAGTVGRLRFPQASIRAHAHLAALRAAAPEEGGSRRGGEGYAQGEGEAADSFDLRNTCARTEWQVRRQERADHAGQRRRVAAARLRL